MKASWLRWRSRSSRPAWYGSARTPGGRQPVGQRVDFAARRAVDDAGVPAVPREDLLQLLLQRGARQDAVDEVGPIERADELDGVAQLQLRRDVAPDARGRRRGERVQADAGKPRAQRAELPVLRAEVVAPLADAVRLVDRDEARRGRPSAGNSRCPPPRAARARHTGASTAPRGCRRPPTPSVRRERAVVDAASMPFCTSVSTWSFISEMSGEMTSPRPPRTSAGAWKHSDLPPPVGSTTTESRPSRIAAMASRCSGRKDV